MFTHLTIFKKGLVLFSFPLLFQFLLIWLVGYLQVRNVEAARQSRNSQAVLGRAEFVLRRMLDSESATRGYILTENPAVTEPFEQAATELPAALDDLRTLVGEHPAQEALAREIAKQVNGLLAHYQEMNRLVRIKNAPLAQTELNTAEGKQRMDRVRTAVGSFIAAERQLASQRDQALGRLQIWLNIALYGGFALTAALTLGMMFWFHREIVARMHTLVENTRQLRLGQTPPPMSGNDHIAAMDRTFREAFEELSGTTKKLREVTTRMTVALMSAKVGTWTWNFRDDSIIWDDGMHMLFGLKAGSFNGKLPDAMPLIAVEDRERVGAMAMQARNTGMPYRDEFRVVWPGGGVHHLASRGEVQFGPDGRPAVLTGVCWDISVRKEAEATIHRLNAELEQRVSERTAELAEANRDLANKNQENEMFVYSVSHDLRSPLVNLQGFSKELAQVARELRGLLTEAELAPALRERGITMIDRDMAESIRFIQTAVTRLSGIIDALLRLSRAGRVVFQERQVDTAAMVQRIVDSLKSTATERSATIVMKKDFPDAWGDPTALEQVFANLIGNAINYLDPKRPGIIEVGCVAERGQHNPSPNGRGDKAEPLNIFYVKDNGLGIADSHKPKVFQAFQRLHPSAAVGEGMGLTIVQRIVQRHRGRIWFESSVGKGTTFFVALPAASAEAPSPSDPLSRPTRKEAAS